MAIDERRRNRLDERLAATLGHDEATTMFEMLPPVGADLATRSDLERLGAATRSDLERLEERMDARFEHHAATTRSNLERLEERMDAGFARTDERVDAKLETLKHELVSLFRSELNGAIAGQTRAVTIASVSTALSVTGAAFALAEVL